MSDSVLELNYGAWLPADADAPILDLGCGDGYVMKFLSGRGYRHILGVDRDLEALSRTTGIPGTSTECVDVNAAYLRRHKGKFKLIVARQMLYYIDRRDVLEFLAALRDALTEDGVLLVEFFNGSLLSSRFTELKDPFIRTAYTEHAMRRLLQASGLFVWFTGPERRHVRGFRSHIYAAMRGLWAKALRLLYVLERGLDDELPRIYTKSVITVAGRLPRRTCA